MADDLQNLNQTPNSKDPVQQASKQSSKQQELKKESLETEPVQKMTQDTASKGSPKLDKDTISSEAEEVSSESQSSKQELAMAQKAQEVAEQALWNAHESYKKIITEHNKEQNRRYVIFNKRFFIIFIICILSSLAIMGYFCWKDANFSKLESEDRVEKEVLQLSILEGELFDGGLKTLEATAAAIGDDNLDEIEKAVKNASSLYGAYAGVMDVNGKVLFGEKIDASQYKEIARARRGIKSIGFYEDKGLLLAVPILVDDAVRYIMYEFVEKDVVAQVNPVIAESYMSAQILTVQGKLISSINFDENAKINVLDPQAQLGFDSLHERLKNHAVAIKTIQTTAGDDLIIFESFIPNTSFILKGYVHKSAFSASVPAFRWFSFASILLMEICAFCLLYELGKAYRISTQSLNRRYQVKLSAEVRRLSMESVVHRTEHQVQELLEVQNSIQQQKDAGTMQKLKQKLEETAGGLQKTLQSILELTGIERGEFMLNEHEYDLGKMLLKQAINANKKAHAHGLNFIFEVTPSLPKIVYGDEERVAEILSHLLDNAVKYTPQGSVKFVVSGDVKLENESLMLRVRVSDTGKGIEEGVRLRIFRDLPLRELNPYKRLEGFGLAVCYNLLKIMGGFIDVQTVLGKGSTLTACVPQKVRSMRTIGLLHLPQKKKNLSVNAQGESAQGQRTFQDNVRNATNAHIYDEQTLSLSNAEDYGQSLDESQIVVPMNVKPKQGAGIEISGIDSQYDNTQENRVQRKNAQGTNAQSKAKPKRELTYEEQMRELLDTDKGIKNFKNDFNSYVQSCDLFCHIADDRRTKLEKAYRSADWKYYAMLMCSLKNSVRQLGGSKLAHLAAELESAARILGSSRSDYQKIKPHGLSFISARHNGCLKLYDEFVKVIHSSMNI